MRKVVTSAFFVDKKVSVHWFNKPIYHMVGKQNKMYRHVQSQKVHVITTIILLSRVSLLQTLLDLSPGICSFSKAYVNRSLG